MATASRCGLMVQSTKVTGRMTRLTDLESSFMPMETSTRVSGRMTKPTATVATLMPTEPPMLVNGKTINNTERESRPGQMVPSTRVNTLKAKSTEEAP